MGLKHYLNRKVITRIPHQSKFGSEEPNFASFSPGEAMGAQRIQHPGEAISHRNNKRERL